MNSAAYDQLLTRIDAFTRRFYKTRLIRGLLLAFIFLIPAWMIFSGAEYFGHFSTGVRTVLFWGFVAAAAYTIWKLILIPAAGLYRLGKVISHEEAARMIGVHFSHVSDKLLNTLQLKALSDQTGAGHALLLAAIDQRIDEMRPVPFTSAVDTRGNRKYLRYAILPFAALLVVLFAAPSLLLDGSKRLMKHGTYFETPAPFKFVITNSDLEAVQGDDFKVEVMTEGATVPDEVYIAIGQNQFRLEKENRVTFSHTFRNIQQSTDFHLLAGGYNSGEYEIKIIPNPSVLNFNVSLNYPEYTGRRDEVLSNTGDLNVPAGTRIKWQFNARNADELALAFADTTIELTPEKNIFTYSKPLYRTTHYSVTASNEFIRGRDSMAYGITVVPDLYPSIQVEQQPDSFSTQLLYFKGVIKDDYGFTKLTFNYRFLKKGDGSPAERDVHREVMPVSKGTAQDQFFHSWNMQQLAVAPGSELEYYFEVWDNDGVSGAKASRSQSMIFKAPTLDELAKQTEENSEKIKADLQKSLEASRKLQEELNKAAKDMLQKKEMGYEDRKKIEDILKQHKELEKQVEEIRKQNRMNNAKENEYRPNNELAEKKKQLDDLFEKLMSEEMKQLMRELEKMLSELDKEEMRKKVEEMKLDSKDLEKQIDRTLELFKQLEVEQQMKDAIEKLDRMAKEQEQLAEKTEEQKGNDNKELQEKQEELNKEFDQFKEDMKQLEEKNKELEFPQELGDNKEDMEKIDQEMEQSKEELNQNNKKKASQSQKSAAEEMQSLSQKMKQQQQEEESEQSEEDMAALRALLENLIAFSFDQERLMQELKDVNINDPKYTSLAQQQRKLKDDAKVLEDSLLALSKRVVQIQSAVNAEVAAINDNIDKSIVNLQDRLVPQARSNQQYTMTAVNNLALMLSEAMDQMQQQMQMQMQGSGSCKKPKSGQGGKPSKSSEEMRKAQQQLNEQMKALKKKMEGQKPGEQKGKGKGKSGEGGMSEELARLAAQQEALRNELQKMSNQENKDGKGTLGDLEKVAKQMEETEKDLVNKRITQETIRRQEEILSRLLESEKADREREQDERRESNEAQDAIFRNPGQFEEFKKLKMKELELLQTIPPGMNSFYKNLVNYYFQTLEK